MHERSPTSHERRSGQPWDASYRDGPAPWDTGAPQPAVVRLAAEGAFTGAVLDAGCGTGANALHIASLGLPVLGVDVAETAISIARANAGGLDVEFVVADALHLNRGMFDTVLDCGLFHAFDAQERREYSASLAGVTRAGGHLRLLCFRDAEPRGPHPVTEDELRSAFTHGWRVASLNPERLEIRFGAAAAWLADVVRD